jgi:hypothetical protein
MKAAEINGAHIGCKIRITNGTGYELTDTLTGAQHEADLIDDRKLSDAEPRWVIGRRTITLTFLHAGHVELSDIIELEVME